MRTQIPWRTVKRPWKLSKNVKTWSKRIRTWYVFAYEHGKTKLKNLVEKFRINRSTVIFKINIIKLADKYPKMLTSSVTLVFSKSYHKNIKSICKENPKLFSWMFYFDNFWTVNKIYMLSLLSLLLLLLLLLLSK